MFQGKVIFTSMLSRNHASAAAFLAPVILLLSLCVADLRSEEIGDERYRPHELGIAAGLYNNSFIDDVISPVVYTASSPIYGLFYRFAGEVFRHTLSFSYVSYNAGLRDGITGDYLEVFYSDGDPYSYPRSKHELSGNRVEINYIASTRVSSFQEGKAGLFLGFNLGIYSEPMKNIDRWRSDMVWKKDVSSLKGLSAGLSGTLERRIRNFDRLSVDLHLTVLSIASRLPYYTPFWTWDDVDPNKVTGVYFMLPNEFLQWSTRLAYVFWLGDRLGFEAEYRFQHHRVTEPRSLRYISHTANLGFIYAIKSKK
jgi:hypothetical protein